MTTNTPDPNEIPLKLDTKFLEDRIIAQGPKRWQWIRDLGAGGFGVVSLEKEEVTGCLRAVKRLDLSRLSFQRINYKREIQTLLAMRGHHLFVDFHGWYQDYNSLYLAMEYIEHGDLELYLKTYGEKAKNYVRPIAKQVIEGLVALHDKKICHRDLKPQNILVASLSPIQIKLADFGASKCAEDTALKTRLGTTGYQAPELLGLLPQGMYSGVEYSNSIDIWALGCLLFKILTLKTPFTETGPSGYESGIDPAASTPRTDMKLLQLYCSSAKVFPTGELSSHVSEWGVDFVQRCLTPDPKQRMTSRCALGDKWVVHGDAEGLRIHMQTMEPDRDTAILSAGPRGARRLAFVREGSPSCQGIGEFYICPVDGCVRNSEEKGFSQRDNLRGHLRRGHGITVNSKGIGKKYKCPIDGCNRNTEQDGFFRKDNLKQHMRFSHGIAVNSNSIERIYKCPVDGCGRNSEEKGFS